MSTYSTLIKRCSAQSDQLCMGDLTIRGRGRSVASVHLRHVDSMAIMLRQCVMSDLYIIYMFGENFTPNFTY